MAKPQRYSLEEIQVRLDAGDFPFSGTTEGGSAHFDFREPSFYAGVALHAGSRIREALREALAVSAAQRYREEDPGTEGFIAAFPLQVVALHSRFEYDLNRSRDWAIPLKPEQAWGLTVWKRALTEEEKRVSLAKYDEFHCLLDLLTDFLVKKHGQVFLFDLHAYCYQREQRLSWHLDPQPVINLGTEPINQARFRKEIDVLLQELKRISVGGRRVSVAENEIFQGGYLARRLCARHHERLAVFALEWKKIFMDEWSGQFYPAVYDELVEQFTRSVARFLEKVRGEK